MKKMIFLLLIQALLWAGLVLYFGYSLKGTGVFQQVLGPLGAGISGTLILSGIIAKSAKPDKEGTE
ncbi:hypothetical protein [Spirochaeta lutea]|uniref:Uncharacterized protein n=1 Tax=Spirochaeta lutea TaxID=1480694 RepID=A0A098R5F6_9SPIO|nr:hypothetical protein [Spirochaeta lutea]KGE73982.1 hypothetical protein DC28_02075 [Spirochaeta lutea]